MQCTREVTCFHELIELLKPLSEGVRNYLSSDHSQQGPDSNAVLIESMKQLIAVQQASLDNQRKLIALLEAQKAPDYSFGIFIISILILIFTILLCAPSWYDRLMPRSTIRPRRHSFELSETSETQLFPAERRH